MATDLSGFEYARPVTAEYIYTQQYVVFPQVALPVPDAALPASAGRRTARCRTSAPQATGAQEKPCFVASPPGKSRASGRRGWVRSAETQSEY